MYLGKPAPGKGQEKCEARQEGQGQQAPAEGMKLREFRV